MLAGANGTFQFPTHIRWLPACPHKPDIAQCPKETLNTFTSSSRDTRSESGSGERGDSRSTASLNFTPDWKECNLNLLVHLNFGGEKRATFIAVRSPLAKVI